MMTFETSDKLRLAYVVDDFTDPWRSSETLILLHAAHGCGRRFHTWVPHLSRDFRVVRPDLRGHGASEIPVAADGLTIERLARDVIDLCDHLGCAQVHLAGSSAGAMIALRTAIDHPDRVSTLACFAATAGMKGSAFDFDSWTAAIKAKGIRTFLADSLWHRFDVSITDPRLIEWWLDLAAATNSDLDYAARFVAVMRNFDLRPELSRIICPSLAVVPSSDPEHPLAEYEILRDGVHGLKFVVVDAGYHNITDAIPDRCAHELHAFLTTPRASAGT